ncbi:hypothetical protein L9F63_014391 [Diploptera punctata]|uniref:Cytochrome P450 n=1 Tax=Diploptera punctata TaxID=6984 RepID=A0AAD8A813_DIPPU|nr:hypothetical protein L9F63_014391 [Diploptera punctata]
MSFIASLLIDIFIVLTVLVFFLYLYLTRHFNYWKKHGVPYLEPLPLFGNLKEVFLQKLYMGTFLERMYLEHKDKPYLGIFAIDKPALVVNDLDLIRNILVKDSQYFIDHNMVADEKSDPLFANVIFSLKGDKWKHVRQKLTPSFTSGKMKVMFNLVNKCGEDLVDLIEQLSANDSEVPVKETLTRYTTDAISTCALGIESKSLKDSKSEVRHYMRKVVDFTISKGFAGFLMFFEPQINKLLKFKLMDKEVATFFRKTVWEAVKHREKNGVVRKDLLDCLMELRKKTEKDGDELVKIDGDLFVAQAFAIFAGGFETSSSATTFMMYELAKQPEIQKRLREEICQVLQKHNNQVTYEAIQEMKYLDMVLYETLRKYPVLGVIDRVCVSDYDLPGPSGKGIFTLKAGTSVYIPLCGIHSDPEFYPNPDKFDPERFTEENKSKRHNYAYFPFGEGPRICIGKRFGLMQIKTAFAHILPKFQVSISKNTPKEIVFDPKAFIIKTEDEMYLDFKKITN